jgi:hypothetical protein
VAVELFVVLTFLLSMELQYSVGLCAEPFQSVLYLDTVLLKHSLFPSSDDCFSSLSFLTLFCMYFSLVSASYL